MLYNQHYFFVIAIIFHTEGSTLQFVKTTHLEAVVQRTVATVLVDSNATTLLDLVTLDVHQGTTEVNVKLVRSMTKYSLTLFTLRGLDFHDYFKQYWPPLEKIVKYRNIP